MISAGPPESQTGAAPGAAVPGRQATPPATMPATRLRRVRWAVRAALTVGVAASVAANILHADPHPVSQVIAAWPPLALLLTVELISRVPVHRRALAVVRLLTTAAIAGIAAWVSYFHMAGVVSRYGETGTVPYLLPLSVDGLVIVASISLVELAGRIHDSERREGDPLRSSGGSRGVDVPVGPGHLATVGRTGVIPAHVVDLEGAATSPAVNRAAPATASFADTAKLDDRHHRHLVGTPPSVEPHHLAGAPSNVADDTAPRQSSTNGVSSSVDGPPARPAASRSAGGGNAPAVFDHVDEPLPSSPDAGRWTTGEQPLDSQPSRAAVLDDDEHGDRADSPPEGDMPATAAAIAAWLRSDPTLQPADIAVKINRSLRTVRRHWKLATAQARAAAPTPSTGTEEIRRSNAAEPDGPGKLQS